MLPKTHVCFRDLPRWAAAILLALSLAACTRAELEADFFPKPDLWERWTVHDESTKARFDHAAWDHVLRTYITTGPDGVNRFAYGRVSAADKKALDAYIDKLERTPISRYSRAEQRAFWINLYNALTVRLVIRNYPVWSIRAIENGPLSPDPWDRPLAVIEREQLSLNDIENRILRPIWKDARLHYALNKAAVGSPNLRKSAFTGSNTEQLLDIAAGAYVNNARGVDIEGGKLVVSSIYAWYRDDFGGNVAAVLVHLRRYARPALKAKLEDKSKIDGYRFDWALNDAK